MRKLLLAVIFVLSIHGQTSVSNRTDLGAVDATGAVRTAPMKTGSSLPGTCTVGDEFFKTGVTAGQNLYGCTATNTWTLQAGSGTAGASFQTQSYGATPTFDGGSGTVKTIAMTLTGNVTACTLSNFTSGQVFTLRFIQDGTGSRTVACTDLNNLQAQDGATTSVCSQTFVYDGSAAQALGIALCTGTGKGGLIIPEGSAISGASSSDMLYAKSSGHYLAMNNNNAGEQKVTGSGVDINTSDQVTVTHLASALPSAQGGTDVTTHADDAVLIGNGSVYQSKVIPDCTDTGGNHLNYTQSSNALSCGTSGGGGGSAPATLSYPFFGWGEQIAGATSCASGECFNPSAGVANYGTSIAFTLLGPVAFDHIRFYVGAAAGSSKGFGSQIFDPTGVTIECAAPIATSGGSPDINATGSIALTLTSGTLVSGGVCTLQSGVHLLVMSTDSTALQIKANEKSIMDNLSSFNTRYAGYKSALSTGSGSGLTMPSTINALTFTAMTGIANPFPQIVVTK